ncbi:LolA family protein [Virgibacillus ndiopensis]|uniref:LolA family protein n=1 Tax=Virgibacillus ndiopensis TaxID=2004408 RepID=UPI000C07712C|nr:sigma-E factor regulatory protein RseB domain-containing protein [Virgibacillus ndiopensis]
MENNERKVSDFIDRLNKEQQPDEDEYSTESDELKELYQTVKLVKSVKDPTMPGPDFQKKLISSVKSEASRKRPQNKRKWAFFISIASAAAIIALIVNVMLPFGNSNIVNVMADAFEEVEAYHGTLEIVEMNANGKSTTQVKLEVWADKNGHYYIKNLEGSNKGLVTVNNGEKKWQVHPHQKQVHIFPSTPDGYRFNFELGNEINNVTNALATNVIGEDTIAGRKATILEVTPKGGEPYQIWIDNETKLPLQKQTAMHNAIQYKITYTEIAFNNTIPGKLMDYQLPKGFEEIDKNSEQVVTDINEVQEAVGFTPKTPRRLPAGYVQDRLVVVPSRDVAKIYYKGEKGKRIVVSQGESNGEFKPAANAILGKIDNNTAEIQSPVQDFVGMLGGGDPYAEGTNVNSIRWQQDGFEFAVVGNTPLEELVLLTEGLTDGEFKMPTVDEQEFSPQVEVPYDLTKEKNDQKSVDAGSSPWKLDPVFVAQVFVSLKISPDGIIGDYPISMDELEVIKNTGDEAIIAVSGDKTSIKKVYLKRLVRQDITGIWTVVGYDPA